MLRGMICTVCLLFFWAGCIGAEEPMNLETVLAIAIENNPLIKATDEKVTIKKMDKYAALAWMLPKVQLSYGYLRLNKAPELDIGQDIYLPVLNDQSSPRFDSTGNIALDWDTRRPLYAYIPGQGIPYQPQDNYQLSLEATQVLFAGGALYNNYLIAKNEVQVSQIDKLKAIRELKTKVIESFYGVIATRQAAEVAKTGVASVKAHVNQAQAFFNAGVIPKNDLLTAQVKQAESQQTLISAENYVKTAEAGFNVALARNISDPVVIESEIPEPPLEEPFETLVDTAMKNREEIQTLELQVNSTQRAITAARGSFSPRVAATYKYARTGEDSDVPDYSWSIGVGLEWTLFGPLDEGGTPYSNLEKAKAAHSAALFVLQSQKDQVTFEVKTSYLSAHEAKAKREVNIMAIDQAEENLRILKHKYNFQAATSTDVLDAQTMLDKAKTDYIVARANYAIAIAKLKASMGIL